MLAPGTVSLVDAPQLELAVCRGRDDVRAVQELHVGHSLAVALQENSIYRAFSKKNVEKGRTLKTFRGCLVDRRS